MWFTACTCTQLSMYSVLVSSPILNIGKLNTFSTETNTQVIRLSTHAHTDSYTYTRSGIQNRTHRRMKRNGKSDNEWIKKK